MCVIVYKPEGVRLQEEDLKDCYLSNPDGAGFMYKNSKGTVTVAKGFFSYDEMMKKYHKIGLKTGHDVVFHFRIATSGGISKGTCHPFPVTDDIAQMKVPVQSCTAAVAHNGIIANEWGAEDMISASDTMLAIKYYMSPHKGLALANSIAALSHITNNRFALMDKDGVELHGDWHKVADIYYSNLNWQFTYYKSYAKKEPTYWGEGWEDDYYSYYGDYKGSREEFEVCRSCGETVSKSVNCINCGVPL